jgi:hypothetical protein
MIPATSPNRPSDESAAPTAVATDAIAARTTLTANTDDQENHWSSVPESSSPTTAPATPMTARRPISQPGVSTRTAASDAMPKRARPSWRMPLRP